MTFQSRELCLHRDDLLFFEQLGAPFTTLHEKVVLVGSKEDEFFVGEGSHSIGILIRFILDVQSKKSARDHGVGSEEDVDRIVDSCAASDDLGVVGVKIGVKELDVAFDCSAVCSDLPQITAKGFCGGN